MKTEKDSFDRLWRDKQKMQRKCPHCHCTISFYEFEKKDKKLCENCNRYVFRDDRKRFEYRLKEQMLKRER